MILYTSLKKKEYKERLIDKKIEEYLKIFCAISIVGPKWCGKTWTSLSHAKSVKYINSSDKNMYNLALLDTYLLLEGEYPILIDEWQLGPIIWDYIRRKCDEYKTNGKISLNDLFDNIDIQIIITKEYTLEDIADLILKGDGQKILIRHL